MYSLVSHLSGIYPLSEMHSLLVTLYVTEYLIGIYQPLTIYQSVHTTYFTVSGNFSMGPKDSKEHPKSSKDPKSHIYIFFWASDPIHVIVNCSVWPCPCPVLLEERIPSIKFQPFLINQLLVHLIIYFCISVPF